MVKSTGLMHCCNYVKVIFFNNKVIPKSTSVLPYLTPYLLPLFSGNPFQRSWYLAENLCWMRGYSLYLGFLAPIGLLLFYNCVVFIIVTIELNKHNKEVF